MEQKSINWNGVLTYGLYLGIISILLSVVIWATNIMESLGIWGNMLIGIGNLVVLLILLTIFTVNYRNKYFDGYISYKNAFLFGLLAVLVSIVLGIIYNIIFHKFIDPGYLERITLMMQDKTMEMLQSRGMSEDQIEQAMRRFEDQGVPTVAKTIRQSLIGGVIGGVIMALISAAIGKKKPEDVVPE